MALAALPAAAQDKVKVGVFPVSSTLPYFVALERGFFKEQNIEAGDRAPDRRTAERRGDDHATRSTRRRCWSRSKA